MRFDDRLLTVLNQPAGDRHDSAVRWRQLVDLVARAGPNSSSPVVADALESIRKESAKVDESLRAAAARAVAALPLPLGLLECFAADRLAVSAPVLAAASLDAGQWRTLLASADEETRRFVETLHPELAQREPNRATDALVERSEPELHVERSPAKPATAPALAAGTGTSLSDVVARIERRRRSRDQQPPASGPSPAPGAPALFRWECGPSGDIAWIDGAPRGALIGRSIATGRGQSNDGVDEEVARAFALRAPFRDALLSLPGDGLVSGEWKISGVPAFEPADGRFAGYRGVAMRDVPLPPSLPSVASEILADPDSLRELVHEIKTPLNAIIGFAEIIDGQFLGPADRRYRERAGEIVAQARLLLGAIDDLDFAAKIHSATEPGGRRADLAEQLDSLAASLRDLAAKRGIELEFARGPRMSPCAIEPELADRLLYRLCLALVEHSASGERLRLSLEQTGDYCRFSISRPAALRSVADEQLFDPRGSPSGDDPAREIGFALRLVRGLARIAGGDLVTSPAGIALLIPRA